MRVRTILIVIAVLPALGGCTIGRSADPPGAAAPIPPPLGQPVVLDDRVPGWETSAWLAGDAFCVRSARVERRRPPAADDFVFCEPAPSALSEAGPPLLPAKPLPYVAPEDPQQQDLILVGTVRGDVATVSVTMFGQTATGVVHPLLGAPHAGAYAVWLPRSQPGGIGMSLDDITAVVAYDAAGDVVAQLP